MLKIFFLFSLATFVVADISPKIGEGPISIKDANFVAAVVSRANSSFICSATIISRKCVLTTVVSSLSRDLSVRVGSESFMKDGQLIKVDKVVNHGTYNVAILVLYERLKFGSKIGSISMAMQDALDPVGNMRVYGWSSITLIQATDNALNRTLCKIVEPELDISQICYGTYNISQVPNCLFARYLYGGPCVSNNYLYGVSTVANVNCKYEVGICMNVGYLRWWIDETVKKNSASSLLINAGLVNVMLLIIYFSNK